MEITKSATYHLLQVSRQSSPVRRICICSTCLCNDPYTPSHHPPRSLAPRSRLFPLSRLLRWACCRWVPAYVVQLFDTPCTDFAAACADRYCFLHNPYIDYAAARADRYCFLRTPCTDFAAARADRSFFLHIPCIDCAAARADRYLLLHTPCIDCGTARADRYCFPLHSLHRLCRSPC